jgi:hypothetical protein
MKTGILTTKTIASEDIKDTKSIMGISAKGMEMAQYFLRDKIYSDKFLAVVREYISNAQDEHNKYNIDQSVDIQLKTVNGLNGQWVWSVRDYAMGLNEYDIRNIFGVYFESTKSQENSSIGGFGIGGKAAFSYTDTFYVASYHNGTKINYVCTLGSGTKGIPVGEIYKVSEEPTTEQGIEISLEVKPSDVHGFSNTTNMFVEFFSPNVNIRFKNGYINVDAFPITPITTKTVGGYTFHAYHKQPYSRYSTHTYFIRMGGVVYPHITLHSKHRLFSNTVIVDVPIGMLSIPISRESIENTPLNEKVFKDIEDTLDKIQDEEIKLLTVPNFGSVISGAISLSNTYAGEWFLHSFKTTFPTTQKWAYKLGRIYNDHTPYNSLVCKGDVKFLVYIMPDIKSLKNWHVRLINALKTIKDVNYDGYVWMYKKDYETMMNELDESINISDCTFVDVKSLKLPKLEKNAKLDTENYKVYFVYGNSEYYTAQELDDYVRNKYFKDADLEDDWFTECDNIDRIHLRTIGNVAEYGTRSNFWTANSKKMIENLQELGWLTPNCDDYRNIKKKFDEKYRIQRMIDTATYDIERLYYSIKPTTRILNVIKSNPEKIQKLKAVKDKLIKEDSTRGRILKSMSDYSHRITRQDLRRILMMKD